jgi:pimeloyl-ACP methyl ester carboxylesterase
VENYSEVNGTRLCWFEWHEDLRAQGTVLLIHATGFHARCWDQTVAALEKVGGPRHVIAVDMRGHGRSDKTPPLTWDTFGRDLVELVSALDLDHVVGAGHSMGGHSLTQTVAALPDRFEAIVLVDPVIMSPEAYAMWQPSDPKEHPVARRRNRFDSPGAFRENLAGRGSFDLWQPAVLKDYCGFGVLPDKDRGDFVLACPPIVEASIYGGSAGTNIYDLIDEIEIQVTVLRAKPREEGSAQMDFASSPTWPELASRFKRGVDVLLPELSHFIPMQAPELVAEHVLKYANGRS